MKVLITGASKGIGEALAYEFAKASHDLILSARSKDLLEELATKLEKNYAIKAEILVADLSQVDGAINLIKHFEKMNQKIDCLVNNAGIGVVGDFANSSFAELTDMLQINILSLSQLTHYFIKQFKEQGNGKILEVASMAGFQPGPLMAAYYASKAYVISLSEALAYELKGTKVSISILCPGTTETYFWKRSKGEETNLAQGYFGLMSAEKVAESAYQGLMNNKLFIIPGVFNKLLTIGMRLTPNIITKRIAALLNAKK